MLLYSYPAVCYYISDAQGYYVYFPDLEASVTQGADVSDAMFMASEYLGMLLADDLEHARILKPASDIHSISIADSFPFDDPTMIYDIHKSFVSMVTVDVDNYLGGQVLVKKTLSIPKWANDLGMKLGLNFSKELTELIARKTI